MPAFLLQNAGVKKLQAKGKGQEFMSKMEEIKKLCEEKQIRMIDFKMTDIDGRWRHITIPVERFGENTFTYGIGFDGSNYGYAPSLCKALHGRYFPACQDCCSSPPVWCRSCIRTDEGLPHNGRCQKDKIQPIYKEAGNGMHVHMLLFKDGKPLFYDENGYSGLSIGIIRVSRSIGVSQLKTLGLRRLGICRNPDDP